MIHAARQRASVPSQPSWRLPNGCARWPSLSPSFARFPKSARKSVDAKPGKRSTDGRILSYSFCILSERKRSNMDNVVQFAADFLKREDGPTAVEYAVMLALIVVVCITAITTLGGNANKVFSNVALNTAVGTTGS